MKNNSRQDIYLKYMTETRKEVNKGGEHFIRSRYKQIYKYEDYF